MKKILFSILVILFVSQDVFSQFSKELPNFILAENSNFIVNILTMVDLGADRKQTVIMGIGMNSTKKISPDDYASPDEGLLNALAQMMSAEFAKHGMTPAAYINMDMSKMMDAKYVKDMQSQFLDVKPAFTVNVMCMDWDKEKKAFKKNKLALDNVKPVSFSIAATGETDQSKIFALAKANMSLGKAFEEFGKLIAEKDDAFFLKTVEVDEEAFAAYEYDSEIIDKMLTEKESLEKFPDEEVLKKNKILVVGYQSERDLQVFQDFRKYLEAFYPYDYELINQEQYFEYIKKDYKYMLMPKGDLARRTRSTTNGNTGKTKTKSQTVSLQYYVIKDLETLDMYYSPDKDVLLKKAASNPVVAFKNTLKAMQAYYGWEEKK